VPSYFCLYLQQMTYNNSQENTDQIIDDNNNQGEESLITIPADQVNPMGFNARYFSVVPKEYVVSKGKAKLFRRGLVLLVIAVAVMVLSIKFIPTDFPEDLRWLIPLIWLPRIAAIVLVVLAFMRIKATKKVKPFLLFKQEGIYPAEDKVLLWEHLEKAFVKYSAFSDDVYNLHLETKEETYVYDLVGVDEFCEDVVAIMHRYWKKYGHPAIVDDTEKN